jgi:3-methyladenine DNA glycosylase AlkD
LTSYFEELNSKIQHLRDLDLAEHGKAYMKNESGFHGVKSPVRKETLNSC